MYLARISRSIFCRTNPIWRSSDVVPAGGPVVVRFALEAAGAVSGTGKCISCRYQYVRLNSRTSPRSGNTELTKKTDGWLAGSESGVLPHDKTRTFGDGAPPYDRSRLWSLSEFSECPFRAPRRPDEVFHDFPELRNTLKAPAGSVNVQSTASQHAILKRLSFFPIVHREHISECLAGRDA
jgi:hypothetical protein